MFDIMLKETVDTATLLDYIVQLKKDHSATLSGFNHEVRNYLTLIHSTAQLLEAKQQDLKENCYWQQISQDIEDLACLLKNFSAYNHCDNLTLAPINLLEIIRKVKDSFEAYATFQQVTISFYDCCHIINVPSSEINSSVSVDFLKNYSCDGTKIKQVLCNILKNALEASPSGDTIEIHLEYNIAEHIFSIIISNHGEKIDSESISSIFELYYTTKKDGNGLGLPISKKIMNAHGGNIQIESTDEETSFSLIFPVN